MEAKPLGSLVDALAAPAETLRLVAQCRHAVRAEGKVWAEFFAQNVRRMVEERSFHGALWLGPGDEVVGLAGWEVAGVLGRRGWLYLAKGFRTRSSLESFLRRLESPADPPLPFLSWSDEVPGVPEEERRVTFAGRGLYPIVRADMRFPKGSVPARPSTEALYPSRSLAFADETSIADLLCRAYADSPERAVFATTLNQREDARRGTHGLLHGEIGRWLPGASFGMEHHGRLVALTLSNEWGGGLITEVAVDPSYRRHGLARQLLPRTIEALRIAGFEVPRLVVTMWNTPAVGLYQSLGFEFVPGGAGRLWLNLSALGVSPPASKLP